METFDVSPLVPQAREQALAAARVYWEHTRPWFVGLVVHGSALKGGFIPNGSDIDFQLYLEDAAFADDGELPFEVALAIQRDLARIDPAPFGYIQTYAYPPHMGKHERRGFVGPVAGAYHLVCGRLPIPEASEEQVLRQARATLEKAPKVITEAAADMLGWSNTRLQRNVRLLCAWTWPILYSLVTLQMVERPFDVWRMPKDAVITLLPEDQPEGRSIRRFYQLAYNYYTLERTAEAALALFEEGVSFVRRVIQLYGGYKCE